MFVKGAPDVLLPRCSSILLPSGQTVSLTPDLYEDLTVLQSRWSSIGQRVLLLTRRTMSYSEIDAKTFGSPEGQERVLREYMSDLVVVGMIGIVDPPRADIPSVVKICRRGGIRFFMVSSFAS
jgi:sodium/potassium-transporting ATPase subunit alpha